MGCLIEGLLVMLYTFVRTVFFQVGTDVRRKWELSGYAFSCRKVLLLCCVLLPLGLILQQIYGAPCNEKKAHCSLYRMIGAAFFPDGDSIVSLHYITSKLKMDSSGHLWTIVYNIGGFWSWLIIIVYTYYYWSLQYDLPYYYRKICILSFVLLFKSCFDSHTYAHIQYKNNVKCITYLC